MTAIQNLEDTTVLVGYLANDRPDRLNRRRLLTRVSISTNARLWLPRLLLVITLTLSIASCSHPDRVPLSVLRIGVLPDVSENELSNRYRPLLDYLAANIGVPCKLVIPESYEHLLQLFHDQQIDLAYFGGMTYVAANIGDGAIPLVMRDVDRTFTSVVLVRSQSAVERLEDTRGMSLSFGSKLSTSGHLMPRHFLMEQGIDPEEFFAKVRYSGAHDQTAKNVRDGVSEVGVANARVIERMFDSGALSHDEVRVIWETPPYVDYVWAVQQQITPSLRLKIRNAFLSLSVTNPEQASILSDQMARAFLPAANKDFRDLTQIANQLGLLEPMK